MIGIEEKKRIVERLRQMLEERAGQALRAADEAREGIMIGSERTRNRGERGAILEETYLISAQMRQAAEYRNTARVLDGLVLIPASRVATGSAVSLQDRQSGENTVCLIVPGAMGLTMEEGSGPVRLVSPESPLGQALMGRRRGNRIELNTAGKTSSLLILAIG